MRSASIFLGLFVGGCTHLMGVSPVVDFEVVMPPGVSDCSSPAGLSPDASVAMEYGFAKITGACAGFFDEATRAQQNALATNKSLDLALIASTAVINATNPPAAAAKAITLTAAGIALSKSLADEYTKIFAFNTHLSKVREITFKTMDDYKTKARENPPTNYCVAYSIVQSLATLCSLSALKQNLDGQVALPSTVQSTQDAPAQKVSVRRRVIVSNSVGRPIARPGAVPSIGYSVVP